MRRGVLALVLLPERDCNKCSAAKQREYGCNAKKREDGSWENRSLVPLVFDGEETWGCPRRPLKDDPKGWGEILELYSMFKKGHLADEGAIASQAQRYVRLMQIVDAAVNEGQAFEREQDRPKESRRGR